MTGIALNIEPEALEPIIRRVVEETLARMEEARAGLDAKLAYGEVEAARLLSLAAHQLRDERLRGRIQASVGPGRRVLYARADLLAYLRSRRWQKESAEAD